VINIQVLLRERMDDKEIQILNKSHNNADKALVSPIQSRSIRPYVP
jgi:hypothetical protein